MSGPCSAGCVGAGLRLGLIHRGGAPLADVTQTAVRGQHVAGQRRRRGRSDVRRRRRDDGKPQQVPVGAGVCHPGQAGPDQRDHGAGGGVLAADDRDHLRVAGRHRGGEPAADRDVQHRPRCVGRGVHPRHIARDGAVPVGVLRQRQRQDP